MRDFSLPPRCEISCVLSQSFLTAWPLLMASTVYPKMPITKYQWNRLLACLTLANSTDRMSQNFDNTLPKKRSFFTAWPLLILPKVCPKMPIKKTTNETVLFDCLTLANSTDSMSKNVGNKLPIYAAENSRRALITYVEWNWFWFVMIISINSCLPDIQIKIRRLCKQLFLWKNLCIPLRSVGFILNILVNGLYLKKYEEEWVLTHKRVDISTISREIHWNIKNWKLYYFFLYLGNKHIIV